MIFEVDLIHPTGQRNMAKLKFTDRKGFPDQFDVYVIYPNKKASPLFLGHCDKNDLKRLGRAA